jgi:hypothetical protein
VAGVLQRHVGRPLEHVDPGLDAWRAAAVTGGVPEDYAALLTGLLGLVRDGRGARPTDGVERALGRPATSFAEWADREAGALRRVAAG